MWKKLMENKWKLLLSSLLTLAPMLVGLILWKRLPEQMAMHWGMSTGNGTRAFVVFGMPLILFALNILCLVMTAADPRNREQTGKGFGMVFWIMPALSAFVAAILYTTAFGHMPSAKYLFLFLGALLAVMGNYMPKLRANHTIGIKLVWTVYSEENWHKTHRLAGKLWMIGGILAMACAFLPTVAAFITFFALLLVMVLVPAVYSYAYYKKQLREGTAEPILRTARERKMTRIGIIVTSVILVTVFAIVAVLMFTGDIHVVYNEENIKIEASYYDDHYVAYDAITDIEYRESGDLGSRVFGYGSPHLSMGGFKNEEFDTYTRYTYTQCDAHVVIIADGHEIVLNGKTVEETKKIYEQLLAKVSIGK